MKLKLSMIMACLVLAACQGPANDDTKVEPVATSAAAPDIDPANETQKTILPNGFKTPLPAGVVIIQPYKVRMDVEVPNKDGSNGRRTDFAFLQGDAEQAMQSFAESMSVAGFVAGARTEESGVIRQAFSKPGYGAVFARAEVGSTEVLKDPEAKGFLVAAWPQNTPAQATTVDVE